MEHRTKRLIQLAEVVPPRVIAEQAKLSEGNLKQILAGTLLPPRKKDGMRMPRSVGRETKVAIEAAFRLGDGWLDGNEPVPSHVFVMSKNVGGDPDRDNTAGASESSDNGEKEAPTIPPTTMFYPANVANTFRLMGNLLASVDDITRGLLVKLVQELIEKPGDLDRIAKGAAYISQMEQETGSDVVNKIVNRRELAVETGHGPLTAK